MDWDWAFGLRMAFGIWIGILDKDGRLETRIGDWDCRLGFGKRIEIGMRVLGLEIGGLELGLGFWMLD